MSKLKYIPTDYSSSQGAVETPWSVNPEVVETSVSYPRQNQGVIETPWSVDPGVIGITGYHPILRNRNEEKPVQETAQAKPVSRPAKSTTTASITISPAPKKSEKGTITLDGIDVGNMKHVLDKLADAGISVRVTSGRRDTGKVGKAGSKSYHITGNAIDIVPGKGETFESIRQKIKNNPKLLQYFRDNKIGIIDETNEETMRRTGATGAHWHIGPDRLALSGFETMFAKQGGNIPSRIDLLVKKFNNQFNK